MKNAFGERLKELREARKLTQEELGKMVGTTRQTISNYEIGKRKADYEMLEALADIFNVDIDYLLGKTNKTTLLPQSMGKSFEFKTPQEAVDFLLKQNVIMGYNGLDITKLSEEEQVEYANEILNQIKLVSYKYKD